MQELDLEGLPSSEVQGNVLRELRFAHARFLFLAFVDAPSGRDWLRGVRPTSDAAVVGSDPGEAAPATTVALTYTGLAALGVRQGIMERLPQEFREGMPRRSASLHDAQDHVEKPFTADSIHVLVSLYADDESELEREVRRLAEHPGVTWLGEQRAQRLPDGREHFGFRDGISQPITETPDGGWKSEVPIGRFLLFESGWNRGEPDQDGLELVRLGTFLVYRKLEQDVTGFRRFLEGWGADPEFVAAKLIGRWRNGRPVGIQRPDAAEISRHDDQNAFDFTDDLRGEGVPYSAHIRRANPRARMSAAGRRILRRGIPYGPPVDGYPSLDGPVPAPDGRSRGLIFISLQASISEQFEFVQRDWINSGGTPRVATPDPIVQTTGRPADCRIPGLGVQRVTGLVTFKGGEYFFVPRLEALELLAKGHFSR